MKRYPKYTLNELCKENVELLELREQEALYRTSHTGFVFSVPIVDYIEMQLHKASVFKSFIEKQLNNSPLV